MVQRSDLTAVSCYVTTVGERFAPPPYLTLFSCGTFLLQPWTGGSYICRVWCANLMLAEHPPTGSLSLLFVVTCGSFVEPEAAPDFKRSGVGFQEHCARSRD